MPVFECKYCGKQFEHEMEDELVDKVHAHFHLEHGKHLTDRKIRKSIE